jgi:type VI secretion system protein
MTTFRYRYLVRMRRWTSSYFFGLTGLAIAFCLTIAQLLTGCSTMSSLVSNLTPSSSLSPLQKISLSADRLSNNGAPVAVDLVLVLDQKPLSDLVALRASEWFNNRQDFMRQYPNKLHVTSWEIVPGQVIAPQKVQGDQEKLVGVLIFADYPGERSFRADASKKSTVRVHLFKNDFSITSF